MAKRLTKVISVAMTEEQHAALMREAERKGARIPDVVREFASSLITGDRPMTLKERALQYADMPREESEKVGDDWESPPDGEVEKALRRMNAEDWAIWGQRRLGE